MASAAWMEARIEAYLDDDLPAEERAHFERRLSTETWADQLALAEQIRAGLHRLPAPLCPAPVTQAAIRTARRETWADWRGRLTTIWRPALAMTVLLIMVLSAALFGGRATPNPPNDMAVQRALTEVKWTLAYLSQVGRETGVSVRRDVLDPYFTPPPSRYPEPKKSQ